MNPMFGAENASALRDANQTEPAPTFNLSEVESFSVIVNRNLKAVGILLHSDCGFGRP